MDKAERTKTAMLKLAAVKLTAFERAKASLLKAAERNPGEAVEHHGKHMIAAQTAYYEVWRHVEHDLNEGHAVAEVLAAHVEMTGEKVGWTIGGGSTCPYNRAAERTRGEVYFRELRTLRELQADLGDGN